MNRSEGTATMLEGRRPEAERLGEVPRQEAKTATVVQVRESLVLVQFDELAAVKKNEVGYVCVGEYLQQDAFDEVDACMPRERQLESLRLLKGLIDCDYDFETRDEVREFFTKVIGLYKNWNYSPQGSPEYVQYKTEIERAAEQPRHERVMATVEEAPSEP